MYHHWKLQKARDPCGEMGGFTRLLTSYSPPKGDAYHNEIPTVVMKEMMHGEARGYVVANRPYSMMQFVQSAAFRERVSEEYVYIAETDHILLRPLPNLATAERPAAFNFGYMVAWGQANIVNKFVPGLGGKTDPVGPSPVIIHVAQLEKIVEPWYDFTIKICKDGEAVQALGWVREMWGWAIAAGKLGIKHRVLEAFQYEGGSIGNRERRLAWPVAATPVGPERVDMPYYIFHYTYGVEYSVEGLPMELQVGEWSLDKRHYMGAGPPQGLQAPPACAHDRAHVLRALYNNASGSLVWSNSGPRGQADQFNHLPHRDAPPTREHATAAKLIGTGPWLLSGSASRGGGAYRLEKLYILNHGWLVSSKGHGRWGVGGGLGGWSGATVHVTICGVKLELSLRTTAKEWSLISDGAVIAKLEVKPDVLALWAADATPPADELTRRVEGSGPYRGSRAGSIYLLRAGVLHAEGGAYARYAGWRSVGSSSPSQITLFERRGAATDAGGFGGKHAVAHFTDCWVLRFSAPSSAIGSLFTSASGAEAMAPVDPPPRYGDGVTAHSAEWIIQPAATLCTDVCAGLTLRALTDADRAASAVARSVEECCSWSWAGFGGLKFGQGGKLTTPWGSGTWGAPPEAQHFSGGSGMVSLLAEFAGFKHLLRVRLKSGPGGGVRAAGYMESTRCNDNDRSTVQLSSGSPHTVPQHAS